MEVGVVRVSLSFHTMLPFNTEPPLHPIGTDRSCIVFYTPAGVSGEGGLSKARISWRIHAEDDRNSRNPIKGKRGWRRCLRPIVQSKFRQYGVWCGCRDSCRKQGWMCAAKRLVSPARVVVGRERGFGRRNDIFQRLLKVPVVTKYQLRGCESEMTGGVVILTPSPAHLTGLPHQGSPLEFSYPSTFIPLLQNVAHIPRRGEGLENSQKSPILVKNTSEMLKNR